eukprot:7005339-Ditylum_brightwellii.AAC.1
MGLGNGTRTQQSTFGTVKLCSNSTLQLVDILSNITDEKFSTTKTGKDRMDYILTSHEHTQAEQKKGY